MADFKQRVKNFLISFDQFVYSIITLGNAAPDETMSAGAYRLELQNRWQGRLFRPFIDWLFTYIQEDHCMKAYEAEVNGTQQRLIRLKT